MRLVPLLQISGLLGALWGAGEVAETLGLPALVAEILVGMLLGPEGTDLVPHVDAFTAAGQLGLLLLVLEGGLHVEMATIRRVGSKAFAIAISGTTLPVLLSMAVLPALPPFSLRDALVAGTSLSSTAIGMAAKLMADMHLLDTRLGQLICCAAMIDDVASLILLAMISSASGIGQNSDEDNEGDGDGVDHIDDGLGTWGPRRGVWPILIPLLSSLIFLAASVALAETTPRIVGWIARAAKLVPLRHRHQRTRLWSWALRGVGDDEMSESKATSKDSGGTNRDVIDGSSFNGDEDGINMTMEEAKNDGGRANDEEDKEKETLSAASLLLLLLGFATALTTCAAAARTTALLGCFMAGVSFASVPGSVDAWDAAMPRLTAWTSRLFFASIGFAVPVAALFQARAVAYGLLLSCVAVASKVVTGLWECTPQKWAVGWAMVGRGELGFVMAEEGYRSGLTSKLTFAVTVWALLVATLLSPIAFRSALPAAPANESTEGAGGDARNKDQGTNVTSAIEMSTEMVTGNIEDEAGL